MDVTPPVNQETAVPTETAFTFEVDGEQLPAILHRPVGAIARCAVVVVVGGPQYRAGSHRQFVLLARELASAGVAVLRFDCRGMGDATGAAPGFEAIGPDIAGALDELFERVPQAREAVLWGLCDAASAALLYAWREPRVTGLVLLNPWVRTEAGEARARLSHYYRWRLVSPSFWRKVLAGRWNPVATARSLTGIARRLAAGSTGRAASAPEDTLPERMAHGLERFNGRVLLVLSGDDLTAAEFRDVWARSEHWSRLLAEPRVELLELASANHTFASRAWRAAVAGHTRVWLNGGEEFAATPVRRLGATT